MIIILASLSFLAVISMILLGFSVYSRNPGSSLNRVFLCYCLTGALGAFAGFNFILSESVERVLFWNHVLFLVCPILLPVQLHFALVFAEKTHLIKRPSILTLMYAPAIAQSILSLMYEQFNTRLPVEASWGWSLSVPGSSSLDALVGAWVAVMGALACIVCLRYARAVKDPEKKRQALLICGGLFLYMFGITVTVGLLPRMGFNPPCLDSISALLAAACYGWAVFRHGLFLLTPDSTVDDIIVTMPGALFFVGLDGSIKNVNPAAEMILGYERDELVGKLLTTIVCESDRLVLGKAALDCFEHSDHVNHLELSFINKEGREKPVSISGSLVRNQSGEPRGIIYVALDLTERIRLEIQLHQAQKMEAIGTLAGGVAHDFNNILTAIIGYSELLKEDLPEKGANRDHLEEVLQAGHRAKEVVRQILTFSRQNENERAPLGIHLIIKEALRLVRSSLPTTIEMRTDVNPCGTVVGNATQIHQIIVNLCTNAYHAMRERGGELEVGLASVDIGVLKTNTGQVVGSDISVGSGYPSLPAGAYVRLSVRDTGHGMTPEVMGRVFDPYFTTKPKDQGSGLGLSVVHSIVRKHGGGINVESVSGEGSLFEVYLPKAQGTTMGSVRTVDFEPVPAGQEKVLFVDDESPIAKMAKQMLDRLGYTVTALTDSQKALKLFQENSDAFDVVVTDMTMPHLTGLALAQELLHARPDLPIVLCTGFNERIDEQKALSFGIRAFLQKPLTRKDLATTLRNVLDSGTR